ncbi:MAG: transketolase [Planctomycetes bacterium]|nr:transketolase [Planctomycetota bacterium]
MPTLTQDLREKVEAAAKRVRINIIKMLTKAGNGHPGGSLGMTDIFVSLYQGGIVRHDPRNPKWEGRDRVVLSNGHICPVLYAALADCGYFPEEWLWELRQVGANLQGHPAMHKTPGIEASTGSLGHGFAMSVGMALGLRHSGGDQRVVALLGDGECQEGLIWEAAMSAPHFKLDNLVAIVDRNDAQIDGTTEDVMSIEPFADKWRAFGWNVIEIDGHDFSQIFDAMAKAHAHSGQPTCIIATTTMGKGVRFMEEEGYKWHGKAPNQAQAEVALAELGA